MKSRTEIIVAIVGPTASGKSSLAVQLARKFNGEIISADSRQVYKYCDVGTGKITSRQMRGVRHYCLNIAHPKKQFTVAEYKKCADAARKQITRKGKVPFIVGGTGFYVQAVVDNVILPEVPPNEPLRKELEEKTASELLLMLKGLDPHRAENIEQKNKRRLMRAIEIVKSTRSPVPIVQHSVLNNKGMLFIGIKKTDSEQKILLRKKLRERFKQGVIEEIKTLHTKKRLSWKRLNDLGLDYRYLSLYLRGKLNKEEAMKKLETELWRYTRRQMNWWKRDKRIHWIRSTKDAEQLVKKFLKR